MTDRSDTTAAFAPGGIVTLNPFMAPAWMTFDRATVIRSDKDWTVVAYAGGGGSRCATAFLLPREEANDART